MSAYFQKPSVFSFLYRGGHSSGESHTVTVGTSTITITPGRIELAADEIIIRGRSKVQLHGDDIDNNPG